MPHNIIKSWFLYLVVLFIALIPHYSVAQESINTVNLHGEVLKITPPEGMCYVPADSDAYEKIAGPIRKSNEGINQVVAIFAKCTDMQEKGVVNDYSALLSPLSVSETIEPRKQYITGLKNKLQRQAGSLEGTIDERATKLISEIDMDALTPERSSVIGMIHEAADMVQLGVLQKRNVDSGGTVMAGVIGITMVSGVPLSVSIYKPYEIPETFRNISSEAMNYAASLIALNEAVVRPENSGDAAVDNDVYDGSMRVMLAYGIYGGAILLLVLLFILLIKPRE